MVNKRGHRKSHGTKSHGAGDIPCGGTPEFSLNLQSEQSSVLASLLSRPNVGGPGELSVDDSGQPDPSSLYALCPGAYLTEWFKRKPQAATKQENKRGNSTAGTEEPEEKPKKDGSSSGNHPADAS
ncbi:hypothetical protein B566_EDAN017020 [Ephemera danica]|nr:hypothetical protein B566_EDAN017020 [Ephemera danica]